MHPRVRTQREVLRWQRRSLTLCKARLLPDGSRSCKASETEDDMAVPFRVSSPGCLWAYLVRRGATETPTLRAAPGTPSLPIGSLHQVSKRAGNNAWLACLTHQDARSGKTPSVQPAPGQRANRSGRLHARREQSYKYTK